VTPTVPGTSRNTRQRAEILTLLDESTDFQSAQRVFQQLRDRGASVGLTTVYRTLQILADADEVDTMRLPNGEQLYRRCNRPTHHHHLVCRECGTTVEITGPAIERWADMVADEHGYTEVSHTIDIFGLCPRCAPERTDQHGQERNRTASRRPGPAATIGKRRQTPSARRRTTPR
jgi:Fur family ferric uptake transcriptional regulator